MLETNLDYWTVQSRESFDYQNAIEINLWNRKGGERAIELEATVNRVNGEVIEMYETQNYPIEDIKYLFKKAWLISKV